MSWGEKSLDIMVKITKTAVKFGGGDIMVSTYLSGYGTGRLQII